jgi:hypothetical protein
VGWHNLKMKPVFYERLFQLHRCLEQVCGILDLYELDGVIHPVYAGASKPLDLVHL